MNSKGFFEGQKEDVPFFKKCGRFEPNSHIHDHRSALIYLKLRNDGCQKHLAQKFCSKAYCRVDSTREMDGPLGHKVLKIKKPKGVVTTLNGWTSTRPHYELGNKYWGSPSDFLEDDTEDKNFEKHFRKHEDKIKEDYKSKIHSLKLYFEDINSKCNFTKLDKQELFTKLKSENVQLRRGTKWKNLEIISGNTTSRWIDEEQMITPIINTYASPTASQIPTSPGGFYNRPLRTRAASQELLYDSSRPASQRLDYIEEKIKSPKQNLRSEATTAYTFDIRTPRIPDIEPEEGVSIARAISMKIPQLEMKLLELDAIQDNPLTSSEDHRPVHNRIQSEDFSNFLKAYEELENQTKLLYQLTNDGPETFHYMTKKERINASRKQSLMYNNGHPGSVKPVMKNDGLADEFNRINYFYYNKEKDGSKDADLPEERKKMAAQMMQSRKEKHKIEKSIFEAIVRGQAQKDRMEENAIDTQNIELLKKKIEEVKTLLKKKVGLDVFEHPKPGFSRQESMVSNYTNSSARSLPKSQMSVPPLTASVSVSPRLPTNKMALTSKLKTNTVVPQKSIFQKSTERKNHLSIDGLPPKSAKSSQVSFSPTRF